jgi:uncharacterized protein YjeT (DUF2065 family)
MYGVHIEKEPGLVLFVSPVLWKPLFIVSIYGVHIEKAPGLVLFVSPVLWKPLFIVSIYGVHIEKASGLVLLVCPVLWKPLLKCIVLIIKMIFFTFSLLCMKIPSENLQAH